MDRLPIKRHRSVTQASSMERQSIKNFRGVTQVHSGVTPNPLWDEEGGVFAQEPTASRGFVKDNSGKFF